MLIISALLIGEVLAVRQDRALAQAAEHSRVAEERRHFDDIGEGIKIAVRQGQTQFDATVKQQTDQFNATMGKAEQNLNQMTGGHAYPLVTVLPIPMKGTANKLRLALSVVGETPLFDVSVELRPLPLPKKLSATDFVTSGGETPIYSSPSISSNRVLLLPAIEPSMTQQSDYLISTIARNGSFTERLHLRNLGVIAKTKDGVYLPWEQSWEITRRLPSNKEMVIATQPWQKMEFVHGEVAAE
jgi:flagellar hook-basal body complex protein FliE